MLYNIDMERLIGVVGWNKAADLVEMLNTMTEIEDEDKWIIHVAAEMGFETGQVSPAVS